MDPILYEINTRCWVDGLSRRCGQAIDLGSIPNAEFDRWEHLGFTHIWLMGVWSSGRQARRHALAQPGLQKLAEEFCLPTKRALGASPYAIDGYHVSPSLGGRDGLDKFRRRLHERRMKLILDFIPNHVGLDHPWVRQRPWLFMQSESRKPHSVRRETAVGRRWFAHGKDPNFPPWTDTVQLDYGKAETRRMMTSVLGEVAGCCDGVRCDMAMLVLNEVFERTWQAWQKPELNLNSSEFWTEAISSARAAHPGFLLLAEVYWGLENRLQDLGFDYTYDKTVYDLLLARRPRQLADHLLKAAPEFIRRSAHFLENHDEPRIASLVTLKEHRAAALLMLTLPGMRFLHDGQLSGLKRHTPVQFGRWLPEETDEEVSAMYEHLLTALKRTSVGRGRAELLQLRAAREGNPTHQNLVSLVWKSEEAQFDLVIANLADHPSQGYVPWPNSALGAGAWVGRDALSGECYEWSAGELTEHGLYLDVPPHGAQLLRCGWIGGL